MFRSNNCVAIHLADLSAAEDFYTKVLKFELLTKTDNYLEYDTGHFLLYVNRDPNLSPPILSFCVRDIATTKKTLLLNGCAIVKEGRNSLYFRDPFGITYDAFQDVSFSPQQQTKGE